MDSPTTTLFRGTPGLGPAYLELERPSGVRRLGFVETPNAVLLIARERSAAWPIEVLRDGLARLRIAGRLVEGSAELVTAPAEKAEAADLFRRKYGADGYARWYADPARVLRVVPGSPSASLAPREGYERWLQSEFDNVAEDYDRHITGNRMNRMLRDRSLAELRRAFHRSHSLLEIGCGSGMETLPLLHEGHEILCVDISDRMLDVVRTKARAQGLSERLRTVRLSAGDLGRLSGTAEDRFDGAYSTYGAMNCEPDIHRVGASLFGLLPSGAPFVTAVYNRWCLFEMAGYGLTGRFSRALGRASSPVPVGASRFCVDVYAYSLPEFRRSFSPWFRAVRTEAVPVVLPPSDLSGYAERFARHWGLLERIDRAIGGRPLFSGLGDHFLLTLLRRESENTGSYARSTE